jgi:hypothetical protein
VSRACDDACGKECGCFPCGKIVPLCKECKLLLARGHNFYQRYKVVRDAAHPSQTVIWSPPLCDECCGAVLANAWCLSALIVDVYPELALESAVLSANKQTAILKVEPPQETDLQGQSVSVGQGVQVLLSLVNANQVNGDLAAMLLATATPQYAFEVRCPLEAKLTLQLAAAGTAEVAVLWRLALLTCSRCKDQC